MMKIIINADDFGLSEVVNKEIEDALKHNWISSTTILANTKFYDDVVRVAQEHPDKSFGVHLNLTEGPSLTQSEVLKNAGMIDEQGCFIRKHNFYMRVYDQKIKKAVELEWEAQIDRIISHDIRISHIDGHHHCHTWHGFEEPLLNVMKKYGIKKVRRTFRNPFEPVYDKVVDGFSAIMLRCGQNYSDNVRMNRIKKSIRSHQDRLVNELIMKNSGMVFTDYFSAFETFYPHLSDKFVKETNATIELMCHPGHPTYKDEYEMIKKTNASDFGLVLLNYNELY